VFAFANPGEQNEPKADAGKARFAAVGTENMADPLGRRQE